MSDYGDNRDKGNDQYSRGGGGDYGRGNSDDNRGGRDSRDSDYGARSDNGRSSGYANNNSDSKQYSNSGGYSGGGGKKYTPPPFKGMYKTYAISYDKDTPREAIDDIVNVARELNEKGWIMRVSATAPDDILKLDVKQEVVLPFSSFTYEGKSETYFPSINCKKLAILLTRGWDNIPEKAQSFAVHNWSLMIGRHMTAYVQMLLTWTPDGIVDGRQCSRETGYSQPFLDIATKYNVPIFNFKNSGEANRALNHANRYFNKHEKQIED